MKNLIITTLLASLLLTACGKKAENKQDITKDTSSNGKVEVLTDETKDGEEVTTEETNEQSNSETENTTDKENSQEDESNSSKTEETPTNISSLTSDADYISRVRISSAGSSTDVTFLEDYKGDLSNIVFDLPENLSTNKEYIIFYVDGKDGKVSPLSEESSFIEVNGSDDSRVKYLENQFGITSSPAVVEEKNDPTENLRNNKSNVSGVEKLS